MMLRMQQKCRLSQAQTLFLHSIFLQVPQRCPWCQCSTNTHPIYFCTDMFQNRFILKICSYISSYEKSYNQMSWCKFFGFILCWAEVKFSDLLGFPRNQVGGRYLSSMDICGVPWFNSIRVPVQLSKYS